jgi:hypothetical protein
VVSALSTSSPSDLAAFASYIKQETLSQRLDDGSGPEGAFVKSQVIEGNKVMLAVKRTGY